MLIKLIYKHIGHVLIKNELFVKGTPLWSEMCFFKVTNLDVKVFYSLKKKVHNTYLERLYVLIKIIRNMYRECNGRARAEKIEYNKIINFQGTEIEKINIKITKRNLEFSVKIENVRKHIKFEQWLKS